MLIIRAHEIDELLPMSDCIQVMDRAMRAVSSNAVDLPPRTTMPLNEENFFILMPGASNELPVYGAKVVSLHPGNPAQGRPSVQGFITLFDRHSGEPVALMDGARITALRTAAASALATRELAREGSASLGLFGNGVLAAAHLEAMACVRDIRKVLVWGRNSENAIAFARNHKVSSGLQITATTDPAAAAACDIVCLVTNSPTPVFRKEWLRAGSHLNLVGAHRPTHREADTGTVTASAVYVDSREGAMREAGDILIPIAEGRMREKDIVGEIGEVLNGSSPGRLDDKQVTLYKSLGIVAQDLFAADQVYRAARARGLGQEVSLD